jgi:multidrug efflux pump subunit AcrA (membrane-fusion protein)
MRILKAMVAGLLVILMVFLAIGCSKPAATATVSIRDVKVTKGAVATTVTGTAQLALAETQELSFQMAGTVDTISVSAGDSVKKGQQLVNLDLDTWNDQIATLQKAVTTAQRTLASKQSSLATAQRSVASKQLAVTQAELDLQSAQNSYNNTSVVATAQAAVDAAQRNLDNAKTQAAAAIIIDPANLANWNNLVQSYQTVLDQANVNLKNVANGTGLTTSTALQVAQAQLNIQSKQLALQSAKDAVTDAQTTVNNAQLDVNDAQSAVTDAQDTLKTNQALSPIITAPFDGFITTLSVKGGDQIQKGKVAMIIADPNQFEINFAVAEADIFSIKMGQSATVTVDASSGNTFAAKITAIAPTATISSGVVSYTVTATLTSLIPINSTGSTGAFTGSGFTRPTALPSGVIPSNLPTDRPLVSAFASGTLPTDIPAGFQRQPGQNANPNATSATPTAVALKQGLTSSITITTQQKTNVLLVPNRAISTSGGKSYVQLVNGSTVTQQAVTTGLSDSTNTEITSGLNEGDTVQVKSSTSSSSSTIRMPAGGGAGIIQQAVR